MALIHPDWPAPSPVQAVFTTRDGGSSTGVYAGLNLGLHVADLEANVVENRRQLREQLQLTQEPVWLNQVHGVQVWDANQPLSDEPPTADAAVTTQPGVPLTVMTADCLPVLFCNKAGTVVASAHAGWRSLCHGVLENTVAAMGVEPADILVWLGPAIGPAAFEVGGEVRAAFIEQDSAAGAAFIRHDAGGADKWLADIFLLARQRLIRAGVNAIYGGGICTYSDPERFYSYRRDGQTGRMSGLIWLSAEI
jgi:YfiH family protein